MTACGTACVDTAADASNCGACAHSCLAGTCVASLCQPYILALAQQNPLGLSQDATNLYWANEQGGTVMGIAKAGGPLKQIGTGQASPWATASDGVNVYWVSINDTALFSAPVAGGGPVQSYFPGQLQEPAAIALTPNDGALVFSSAYDIFLTSVPPASTPSVIAPEGTSWIVVDSANAYVVNDSSYSIDQVSLIGMPGSSIASIGVPPSALALFAGMLYVGSNAQILSLPTTGPTANPFAMDSGGAITGIFADASGVYWTNNNGTLSMVPLAGATTPTVLATGQGDPAYPLTDAKALYWIDVSDGTIMGLAK